MPQLNLIRIACQNCTRPTYYTFKNRRTVERKLELKKFCRYCRKHTAHKETKRK